MKVDAECQEIIKRVGTKIKLTLKEEQMSNRMFAKLATIGESTLRTVVRGSANIELSTLVKLSLALNIALYDLFNSSTSKNTIIKTPLTASKFEKTFKFEKQKIGLRISDLLNFRKLKAETLSLISFEIDYSDTIKYLKGEKNITLLTLLKYAKGLEVELLTILDDTAPLPTNEFKGKMKEK